jgi:serine/threonine protein phosphatase PrpC
MKVLEKNTIKPLNQKRKYTFESIKGLNKRENQDNYLVIEETDYSIYFIFDGVGSALNSKKATELSKKYISQKHSAFFSNGYFDFSGLMYETNQFLIETNIPQVKTTYCSVCLSSEISNKVQYSSLGDSRVYLINPQYLTQITKDDRYLSRQNVITKCLGMLDLEKSDFYTKEFSLSEKEQILLCSDGFYSLMEKGIASFFETFYMQYLNSIKRKLNDLVKGNNIDDSTYVLIK